MSLQGEAQLSSRMEKAIEELRALIAARYPEATFRVSPSPENPNTILLWPMVDLDDLDEVMDVVIDRLVEMQNEYLPLLVVPVRPPARDAALRAAMRENDPAPRRRARKRTQA